MQSKSLYKKYSIGKHWKNHPSLYAMKFTHFLKSKKFNGLIVDLGSGTGRDVEVFRKLGFNSLGIDYSKEDIKLAKRNFPESKFEIQNIEGLKFEDNSVDSFFMINVIHYVNKEKAIKEILRTLKPKGYLFIHFNLNITDDKGKIDYLQSEKQIFSLISNFKIIEKYIFERIDEKPIKHTHKILELILQKP